MENHLVRSAHSDLIENPSPRCACVLVLDTSGSMSGGLFNAFSGNTPIAQLNSGLKAFIDAVKADEVAAYSVEVCVITAGGTVKEILPFSSVAQIESVQELSAQGNTPLGQAVSLALKRLDERKNEYKRNGITYYQPWMVIISDGAPDHGWETAASEARSLSEQRKLVSIPIGVEGADMDILSRFSSKPAKKLNGLKFREFFEWLSASMSRVSASNSTAQSVSLPPTDSWDSI
jgi:uncharacterized protein YegL